MNNLKLALLSTLFLAACDPVPVQYPPGAPAYPPGNPTASANPAAAANPPVATTPAAPANPTASIPATSAATPPPVSYPQPQASGTHGQYVWERMMDGVAMGGSIAGPYGAAAGLVLGAFYGLATADAHYAQINAQIQTEQAKDKDLEAQIDREMARQRGLETQLGNSGAAPEAKKQEPIQMAQKGSQEPKAQENTPVKKQEPAALASLDKKDVAPSPANRPFKNVEVRDTNGDGIPDLWIYYNPLKPGEIIREEEDTDGDGRVDTWSYFSNGKLVRREVDSKKTGRADTVYYYQDEKIVREERDENGDGQVSYRAYYQNGRLAKVEKDLEHRGKMDLWTYYDTSKEGEVVSREERDLDGDGTVDLWSYYEGGRLVRRDVSAVGLKILAQQEKIPSAQLDTQTIPHPHN